MLKKLRRAAAQSLQNRALHRRSGQDWSHLDALSLCGLISRESPVEFCQSAEVVSEIDEMARDLCV